MPQRHWFQHRRWSITASIIALYLVYRSLSTSCEPPLLTTDDCSDTRFPKFKPLSAEKALGASKLDAVVLIMIGIDVISGTRTLKQLRERGRWSGDVFIVTDYDSSYWSKCTISDDKRTFLLAVPQGKAKVEPHMRTIKTMLLDLVPTSHKRVLYLDADILVAQPLGPFLTALERGFKAETQAHIGAFSSAGLSGSSGGCLGCASYYGEVLYLERDRSESCLKAWGKEILSDEFEFDQQALDVAAEKQSCVIWTMPDVHLMFLRDFWSVLYSPAATFTHVTGLYNPRLVTRYDRWVVRQKIGLELRYPCAVA